MCAMVDFVFVIYLPEWINLRLHIIWLKHFHSRRIRDELAKQNEETTELTTKLDKEIHSLKAQLEAAKYDVIKYCIGTIVSISAVGLAVLRIVMWSTDTFFPLPIHPWKLQERG
jgi:hypothetical protein